MYVLDNFIGPFPHWQENVVKIWWKKFKKYVVLKNENKYYGKIKKFRNTILCEIIKKLEKKIKKLKIYTMLWKKIKLEK